MLTFILQANIRNLQNSPPSWLRIIIWFDCQYFLSL